MATITVTANANLATLGYAADDDIVINGAAVLTCNSNPNALPAIRSIRSSSARASFVVRNTATAFVPGNLWRLSFTNPGSAIGANNATLGFSSGATLDVQGEWLECYTATGAASETVLDASNVLGVDIDFPYFIEAETAPGSGVWKAVPVGVVGGAGDGFVATVDITAFGTGDVGRVLFYNRTTRLLQTGNGTNGSLFASGTKFRIPNIFIHMAPFTVTVAAGGWTTGAGAQNVVSSANAPVISAGTLNYLAGVEQFNVSAAPSGTTVTVNNRGGNTTTATAHASGVLAYALPFVNSQMAGRIGLNPSGIFKATRCWFGRWLFPVTSNAATWVQIDAGVICGADYNQPMLQQVLAETRITRGVVYANPGSVLQSALRCGSQPGDIFLKDVLVVTSVSVSGGTIGQGNGGNPTTQVNGPFTLKEFDGMRFWRLGFAASMNNYATLLFYSGGMPEKVNGIETVGGFLTIAASNTKIKGWRFSLTNGALTTSNHGQIMLIGNYQGALSENVVFYDFDFISGGVAPFSQLFGTTPFTKGLILHNKINGVPRTLDMQGRTSQVFASSMDGTSSVFACAYFTNTRLSGQGQFSGSNGVGMTLRNLRIAHPNGTIQAQPNSVYDFPPAPISGNGIPSYEDMGTFVAAPNTYPSLIGGIYLGPVSRENNFDQFELTGSAYNNNGGEFYLETAGDSVLFNATKRITGVASITGSPVVYVFSSNITTGCTAEFRLCKWGDNINAATWATFTGTNVQAAFNALTGYTSAIGLNFQLRFTATTSIAGRYIRNCYVPCQMDAAYNPYVGSVDINAIGAASNATAALYVGSSLWTSGATNGAGAITFAAPYDFDDVAVAGTIKIRALQAASIDAPITWAGATSLPAPMASLTGYVAGPYPGASFNKSTKTVTVSSAMTTQQLWSAWREYIVQLANFDTADSWSYPALNLADWNIVVNGADLTGNLTTTGTATQTSGGRFLGVVVASNGTSGLLTLTDLTSATVALYNNTGARVDYQASVTGTYTYALPFGSTGTWRWVVKRVGREHASQTFQPSTGSAFQASPSLPQKLNPDGSAMYQGTTSTRVTVEIPGTTNAYLDIGNGAPSLQAIFDESEQALITQAGMDWLGSGKDDIAIFNGSSGDFLFLTAGWRVRRRAAGDASATVPAFVQSTDGEFIDESNGSVQYQTSDQASVIAATVLAQLQATRIPVDVRAVNGLTVDGTGTESDPWGPA